MYRKFDPHRPYQTSFESPWQSGVAERLVGSCRRGLLVHIIAVDECHLERSSLSVFGATTRTARISDSAKERHTAEQVVSVPECELTFHRRCSRCEPQVPADAHDGKSESRRKFRQRFCEDQRAARDILQRGVLVRAVAVPVAAGNK